MSDTPAGIIRRYLDEHGGEVEVPFHNLVTTWGNAGGSGLRMTDELATAGVVIEPPLAGLDPYDRVHLRVVDGVAAGSQASSGAGAEAATRRLWLAAAATVVALAVGSGVGFYFVGKASGEDTDAGQAAGQRAGQRDGAARGAKLGYRETYGDSRRVGYRQTYGKAYRSARKKAIQSAATGGVTTGGATR